VPLEVIVCVLENKNTLGALYISYSATQAIRKKNKMQMKLSTGKHLQLKKL